MKTKPQALLRAAEIAAMPERQHVHQFNANAIRHTRTLGTLAGLEHIGLHLIRLAPGADSTEYHSHDNDEEFLYVIAGRGIAILDDEEHDIGPGDIMAFPRRSIPHAMRNPYDEDLVYLMGGERNESDVVHYPRLRRSMVKTAGRRYYTEWDDQHDL
ncbi:MAG: cupin domain-containing protein [Pseudomonadota bacterium]